MPSKKKRARLALDRYALEMERLAEERARQLLHQDRLATIGTMSAGIAHEIKNPLAYIATNVQTLRDSWPDLEACLTRSLDTGAGDRDELEYLRGEIPSMLDDIKSGVQRIVTISDGLKDFARKSAQEPTPHRPGRTGGQRPDAVPQRPEVRGGGAQGTSAWTTGQSPCRSRRSCRSS